MSFQLGVNTQTIRRASLVDKLLAIAGAGFTHIEPWLEDIDGVGTREYRRLLEVYGLRCSSFIKIEGWMENDGALMGVPDKPEQIFGECERRLEIAAELGAPYLIACPAYSHREHPAPPPEAAAEKFERLLKLGKSMGVLPTIEFLGQSHFINTLDKCLAFLELVGDRDARMVVDSYHLWRGGGSIGDLARAPRERISLLHVNDCDPKIEREAHRDRERLLPGDGAIDLAGFFRHARELGFDGIVSLGVYNPALWKREASEVCREAFGKTQALIASSERGR